MASHPPIKLNGVVLPPHMIAAEAQHHPARTPAGAYKAAARALIVRTLLLEEAKRQGIAAVPEFVAQGKRELEDEAKIRALMEARIVVAELGEADCLAFYAANPGQFRGPDLFEASHILFLAQPHDAQTHAAAMRRAEAVIAELSGAPGRFDSIARELSQCESRANGGRLGQIARGQTVPEIEAALQGLQEGQIAEAPVKSRFGVHVLKVDARAQGELLPFDYVRERVADYLAEKQWRSDVAAYIERLVDQAQIEGIEMSTGEARAA